MVARRGDEGLRSPACALGVCRSLASGRRGSGSGSGNRGLEQWGAIACVLGRVALHLGVYVCSAAQKIADLKGGLGGVGGAKRAPPSWVEMAQRASEARVVRGGQCGGEAADKATSNEGKRLGQSVCGSV